MVLWSAARSEEKPRLYKGKGIHKRPVMGYGNQLYSVDLRCDKADLLWSPSRQEFMNDNIHSISGLLTDPTNPYSVYAKSISAGGQMYEIDTRMPHRTLFTWALPGLCDDLNSYLSPSGIYGPGVLMTQPLNVVNSMKSIQSPILSVNQSSGVYGFQMYQRPSVRPRFQTQNLEMPMTTGLGTGADSTSFATGSSFSMSESNTICGIAAFYTPTLQIS